MNITKANRSEIRPELAKLLPNQKYELIFGDSIFYVPELTVEQYITFSKYIFGIHKYFEDYTGDDNENSLEFIKLLSKVLDSNENELKNYFVNMFHELFPSIPVETIKQMTRRQLFYNIGNIWKHNFFIDSDIEEEAIGKALVKMP